MLKTKKLNRTLALCLCLVMMFSITAFAADTSNELLPLSVVEFFADQGYEISRTAKMELAPVNLTINIQNKSAKNKTSYTEVTGYALRVVEETGNQGEIYETLILKENGDGQYTIDNDSVELLRSNGPTSGESNQFGDIVISTYGNYTRITIPTLGDTYQITSLTWSYYKNSPCNVDSAYVSYGVSGSAYYPSTLQFAEYGYNYEIHSNVLNPVEYTPYANSYNPCPYTVDIGVSGGPGSGGGMYFSYSIYIYGEYYY